MIDVAPDLYDFIRSWWGLKSSTLTDKKCELLAVSVSKWRKIYRVGSAKKLVRMYDDDRELLGYLAAFGPRYAYTVYFLLKACKVRHRICKANGSLSVCLIGGGSAIELLGLLEYLNERNTVPRDIEIHFVDRSPQWRRFHNHLFGSILPRHFPRTRVLPYYHDIDLRDPSLHYAQALSRVFDSKIFALCNVLTEFEDDISIREHMRVLMRLAKGTFYLLIADSNAKKLRQRVSWVADFVRGLGFPYYEQFTGSYTVECTWLKKDETTERIFFDGGPSFLKKVRRHGYVARVRAGAPGAKLEGK